MDPRLIRNADNMYVCHMCGYTTPRRPAMDGHVARKIPCNSERRTFKCGHCTASFVKEQALTAHVMAVHPDMVIRELPRPTVTRTTTSSDTTPATAPATASTPSVTNTLTVNITYTPPEDVRLVNYYMPPFEKPFTFIIPDDVTDPAEILRDLDAEFLPILMDNAHRLLDLTHEILLDLYMKRIGQIK